MNFYEQCIPIFMDNKKKELYSVDGIKQYLCDSQSCGTCKFFQPAPDSVCEIANIFSITILNDMLRELGKDFSVYSVEVKDGAPAIIKICDTEKKPEYIDFI